MVEVRVSSKDFLCLQRTLVECLGYKSRGLRIIYLLDHWQNPGFCVVVSIGANAQVNFQWRVIPSVSSHQAEERVLRGLRDLALVEYGGIAAFHMAFDTRKPLKWRRSIMRSWGLRHIEQSELRSSPSDGRLGVSNADTHASTSAMLLISLQ